MKKDTFDREIDRGDLIVIADSSVVRIGVVEKTEGTIQYWPVNQHGLDSLRARRTKQKVTSTWTDHSGTVNTYFYYPKIYYVQYTHNHRFFKVNPDVLSTEARGIYEEMKKVF